MADFFRPGAAINTLKASWWTLCCARWFGDKVASFDDYGSTRTIVVGYRWRGVLYLMDVKQIPLRNPTDTTATKA